MRITLTDPCQSFLVLGRSRCDGRRDINKRKVGQAGAEAGECIPRSIPVGPMIQISIVLVHQSLTNIGEWPRPMRAR